MSNGQVLRQHPILVMVVVGETCGTVLEEDFSQILDNQLEIVHRTSCALRTTLSEPRGGGRPRPLGCSFNPKFDLCPRIATFD